MADIIKEIISTYGPTVLMTVLTAIATFIGNKIKTIYQNKVNDETKKKVVIDTCKYVEQVYNDLKGSEKLQKAIEGATEILNNKGISISEIELRVLIESVCNDFKTALTTEKVEIEESKEEE